MWVWRGCWLSVLPPGNDADVHLPGVQLVAKGTGAIQRPAGLLRTWRGGVPFGHDRLHRGRSSRTPMARRAHLVAGRCGGRCRRHSDHRSGCGSWQRRALEPCDAISIQPFARSDLLGWRVGHRIARFRSRVEPSGWWSACCGADAHNRTGHVYTCAACLAASRTRRPHIVTGHPADLALREGAMAVWRSTVVHRSPVLCGRCQRHWPHRHLC